MKDIFIGFLAFAAIVILTASGGSSGQAYYRYFPTPDTLTLGSNDTLVFLDRSARTKFFGELYSYNITLQATQLGDTASTVILILQESNEFDGTNWYELERDTVATGATLRLHGGSNTALGYIKGHKARVIIDDVGGSGADTTLYNLDVMLKQ